MTTIQTLPTYTQTGAEIIEAVIDCLGNRVHPDYRTITASGSATVNDHPILADAPAGAITLTLVAVASAAGKTLTVIKTDSSGNAVTLDGNASETINGSTTHALAAQYNRVRIFCTGSAWLILHA